MADVMQQSIDPYLHCQLQERGYADPYNPLSITAEIVEHEAGAIHAVRQKNCFTNLTLSFCQR